jgi:hypothetical protein
MRAKRGRHPLRRGSVYAARSESHPTKEDASCVACSHLHWQPPCSPPSPFRLPPGPAWSEKSDATIVETAIALSGGEPAGEFDDNPNDFDILINALLATGAIGLFDGTDYTVFAPTDQAFIALAQAFVRLGRDRGAGIRCDRRPRPRHHRRRARLPRHRRGPELDECHPRQAKVTMLDGNTITARGGFVDAIGSDAGFVPPTCAWPTE